MIDARGIFSSVLKLSTVFINGTIVTGDLNVLTGVKIDCKCIIRLRSGSIS